MTPRSQREIVLRWVAGLAVQGLGLGLLWVGYGWRLAVGLFLFLAGREVVQEINRRTLIR